VINRHYNYLLTTSGQSYDDHFAARRFFLAPTGSPSCFLVAHDFAYSDHFGVFGIPGQPQAIARASMLSSRVPIYAVTLGYELLLFVYVWLLGLRPRGVGISEIIGGKWRRFGDFLVDLKTAFLFWIVVVAVLAVLQYLVRYNGIKAARPLLPQNGVEITMFVVLSVTAGFCEEFVFRGYLQRQFLALANSEWSAVFAITVYGGLFGILAWRRKSLRPGMMQHAAQDSLSGIAASILIKHKII
jgi:membrane protease YdiL (CAAX protease family)